MHQCLGSPAHPMASPVNSVRLQIHKGYGNYLMIDFSVNSTSIGSSLEVLCVCVYVITFSMAWS